MAAAPRYAFITFEPGFTKRDVIMNLSMYGDVRFMSRVSEVSALVTELVINQEAGMTKAEIPPVVEKRPFVLPVKVQTPAANYQRGPSTNSLRYSTDANRLTKRQADLPMPEPLPKRPPSDVSASHAMLRLPTFSAAQQPLFKTQAQQQALEKQEALEKTIKIEDDLDMNQGLEGMDDAGEDMLAEDLVEEMDEPCSSSFTEQRPGEVADDLSAFMDEEGNIEVPYNPDFDECRPRRPVDMSGSKQAQCEVCRRWVRMTNTKSRLIAHVFMHAQRQRFVCPFDDCDYSNKTEPITRRHILSTHGQKMDPIDIEKDKKKHSESWKSDRNKWAPRCFPDHFETAPGGDLFMKVNEKMIIMDTNSAV